MSPSDWKREADRDPTDDELVRRAQDPAGGEAARAAAGELLGRWRERVYLWARRYVRDHDRALDLAQDVLLSAYRGLGSFEGRAPFSAWLFSITRHAGLRAVRRASLVRDDDAEPDALAAADSDPLDLVARRMGEEALLRLIDTHLEPHERTALWLRCVEGLPVESITDAIGAANATGARGVLQTARRKLRAALERAEGGKR